MSVLRSPEPLFRIAESSIHGYGVFATTHIPAGTLIGQEDPLLLFDTSIGAQAWHKAGAAKFYANESQAPYIGSTKVIGRQVNNLHRRNAVQLSNFRSLYSNEDEGTAQGSKKNKFLWQQDIERVKSNAFVFKHGRHAWLAVYYAISRINHSCLPNAMVVPMSTNTDFLGRTNVVATQDILAGQEIFIQYPVSGHDALLLPGAHRQDALLKEKQFQCGCEACSNAVQFDTLFAEISALAQTLQVQGKKLPRDSLAYQSTNRSGGAARIQQVRDYIVLLRRAGFCDERLSEAYLLLALLSEAQKDWAGVVDATNAGLKVEEYFFDEGIEWKKLTFVREECLKKLMS